MNRNDFKMPSYEKNVGRLVSIYRSALLRLQKQLGEVSPHTLTQAGMYALIHSLQAELRKVDNDAVDWVRENITLSMQDGIEDSLLALDLAKTREEAKQIALFNQANVLLLTKAIEDTYEDVLGVTRQMNKHVIKEIRKISAEVIREGMTMSNNSTVMSEEMAKKIKDMQKRLKDSVDVAIVDRGGRKWEVEHYTDMLARTKMTQLHDEACKNEAVDRGAYYGTVSFNASTKDACRYHQGRIVKLIPEAEGNYPTVDQLKMSGQIFHPNCKHFVMPLRDPKLLSFEETKLAKKQQGIGDKALEAGGRNPNNL